MNLADAERTLVARCKDVLVLLDMAVTVAGDNADLADAIGVAVRDCGVPTAAPPAIDDSDLSRVQASEVDRVLDAAELRLLESLCSRARSRYDTTIGFDRYQWNMVAEGLETTLARRQAAFLVRYATGGGISASTPILSTYATPGSSPNAPRYQPAGPAGYVGGPTWP